MELDRLWQELKEKDRNRITEKLIIKQPATSSNPLKALRRSMIWNVGLGMVGVLVFAYLMLEFPDLPIRIILGILLLKTLFFNWKMYQRMRSFDQLEENWNQPIVETIRTQLAMTRKTIQMMEIRTMLLMPLAYLAGLLMGGKNNGIPTEKLLRDHNFLLVGMGISLLTLPIIFFAMRWMHKKTFGDFIDQAEDLLKNWE
jgi:hypothetical protein